MNKKLVIIILLFVSMGLYFFVRDTDMQLEKNRSFADLQDREKVKIVIRDRDETSELAQEEISQESNKNQEPRTLNVEVVNTPQSTTQGLSGRNEIGSDGMLFIFPTTEIRYFWMKDMKFDLDLVWIANGQVIEVTKSVSKPDENTPDYRLETYHAQKAADMVLEIKSGDAQINEISPGDVVLLEQ